MAAAVLMAASLFGGCTSGASKVEYAVLDEALAEEQYGIGFRKDDQSLRDEIQKTLVEMKADGKLAEITKSWFGEDTSTVPSEFTPENSADGSLEKVKQAGKLKLGLDDSFPPMGYRDAETNTIVGYDIDLAKEVCKRVGVELELVPIDWNSKELELSSGKIDCIWNGMTITDERREKMNMSEPYMNNRQVVVTMKGKGISKLSDLAGKTVVLQQGSSAVDALDSRADIKDSLADAVEVDNNVSALYELRGKGGDAVIMDEVVARYYIAHLANLDADASADASK